MQTFLSPAAGLGPALARHAYWGGRETCNWRRAEHPRLVVLTAVPMATLTPRARMPPKGN